MDERIRELEEKRRREGLTEDEAAELGRRYADRDGREHATAADPPPDVVQERADSGVGGLDQEARHLEEDLEPPEDETPPRGAEERSGRESEHPKPGTQGPPPA